MEASSCGEEEGQPERQRALVNRDAAGSTSEALAAILVSSGLRPLPPDSPPVAAAAAAVYLAAPRDAVPWAQLEEGPLTLVNKIRGHELLTRKSKLARLLRDHPAQPHPQTFVLVPEPLRAPKEGLSALQADKRRALAADDERERCARGARVRHTRACDAQLTPTTRALPIAAACERRARRSSALLGADAADPSCWIVKDAQGAKGDNIAICDSAAAAILEAESGRHGTAVVVQRYLRAPLLLPGGRKFDIRLWVLVDPDYRVFAHRQGVCRTSSVRYDPDSLRDTLGHITNHCVQERGAHFQQFEEGNELFFAEFDAVLREEAGVSFGEHVWPQLRGIVRDVAEAARDALAPPPAAVGEGKGGVDGECGVRGWQLFGFDFLVGADKRVHLLEVNGSPAIAEKLRPRIAADLAHLLLARLGVPTPLPVQPASAVSAQGAEAAEGEATGAAVRAAAGEFELVYSLP